MPYYAIAVGREQKITEDWKECFKLTNGYPGNRYKRCETYEAAEAFIDKFNATMVNGKLTDFEVEQKVLQAWTNNLTHTGDREQKTEIYIAGNTLMRKHKARTILGEVIDSDSVESSLTVSALISSLHDLIGYKQEDRKTAKAGDSRLNNYMLTLQRNNAILFSRQEMYINLLTQCLKTLGDVGIPGVAIYTDSSYLTRLLSTNILRPSYMIYGMCEYYSSIVELYEVCRRIPRIYVNYYSGPERPEKLKFTSTNSERINIERLYGNSRIEPVSLTENISNIQELVLV